jgi:hypothetical protein
MAHNDENGRYIDGYEHWMKHCRNDIGTDGVRITCARALEIATDVMLGKPVPFQDQVIAIGVLAAIRLQRGITGPDADALGYGDGLFATHQMDIWIYG